MAPLGHTSAHFKHKLHWERLIRLPLSSTTIASTGHTCWHLPQRRHFIPLVTISGHGFHDSGLQHQRHLKEHPLRNTVVLIPGPSWMLNLWILNTNPRSGEGLLRSGNALTSNLLQYLIYRITEPSAQFNPKCDCRLFGGGLEWACLTPCFGMV